MKQFEYYTLALSHGVKKIKLDAFIAGSLALILGLQPDTRNSHLAITHWLTESSEGTEGYSNVPALETFLNKLIIFKFVGQDLTETHFEYRKHLRQSD